MELDSAWDVSGYVKAVRALLRAPRRNHRALELEWDRLGRRALLGCELQRSDLEKPLSDAVWSIFMAPDRQW